METLEYLKPFFPLCSNESIVKFIENLIEKPKNHNIPILSLVLGWFEYELVIVGKKNILPNEEQFPILTWDIFAISYFKFENILASLESEINNSSIHDVKSTIKLVSDFVWKKLINTFFKDKQHIQSVYSFINGKQLDCFGIAITVLSIVQNFGNDVNLALSEDHAWLVYNNGEESAEITWNGKDNQKKRGESISHGTNIDIEKCWLYLGGKNFIHCDLTMTLVSVVNATNPGMNSKTDSEILSRIQQAILMFFYRNNHLTRFPIAICNLADLEEIEQTDETISIESLYEDAIKIVNDYYGGCHVYPFTYYGGYLYRKQNYRQAIRLWKQGARAVSRFKYSKEDEEAYKEFDEITNTFLIHVFKKKSFIETLSMSEEIFHDTLQYFDYLFFWEEDSKTSVFHENWVKSFIKIISSFPNGRRVEILTRGLDYDLLSRKMNSILDVLKQEVLNKNALRLSISSITMKNEEETSSRSKRRKVT